MSPDRRARFPASPDTHSKLLTGFYQAVRAGNLSNLTHLLAEDVIFWADGGGKARGATTHPIVGRAGVADFILQASHAFSSALPEDVREELTRINGQPALVVRSAGRALAVMTIEVKGEQIQTIRFMANLEKLTHV